MIGAQNILPGQLGERLTLQTSLVPYQTVPPTGGGTFAVK
jgi:hypothetical protein